MSHAAKAAALVTGQAHARVGTVRVACNTAGRLVRVGPGGDAGPAAMSRCRWMDERTLDVVAREDEVFPEGGTPAAHSVGRGFGAMVRWRTPRPPGTQPDPGPRTTCEVSGKHAVRFHLPSQAVRRQPGGSS